MTDHILAVTIDLEDWYHIPPVCGSPSSVYRDTNEFFTKWGHKYDYLSEPTYRVLDILDNFNIISTFFVVADVIEHYPGLVESIVERGHELACHGLDHSTKIHYKTKQPLINSHDFYERTSKAKNMIELISRERVLGYRAPNAYVGGWMLDILRDLNFLYDSSVCTNSLYNKTDSSLEGVSTRPYYPQRGSLIPGSEYADLIEFPFPYFSALGLKIPTSGGPLLRFLGSAVILKGLKQSLKSGNTVFYFHPIDVCNDKIPNVWRGSSFFWAIRGDRVERRIYRIFKALSCYKKTCLRELSYTLL